MPLYTCRVLMILLLNILCGYQRRVLLICVCVDVKVLCLGFFSVLCVLYMQYNKHTQSALHYKQKHTAGRERERETLVDAASGTFSSSTQDFVSSAILGLKLQKWRNRICRPIRCSCFSSKYVYISPVLPYVYLDE